MNSVTSLKGFAAALSDQMKSRLIGSAVAVVFGVFGYFASEIPDRWATIKTNSSRIVLLETTQIEQGEVLLELKGTPKELAKLADDIVSLQERQVELRISVSAIEAKTETP